MNRSYFTRIFIAIMLASLLFITGCSILRPIYGDGFHIKRSKPGHASSGDRSTLRLKVLATPMINMAGFEDEKAEMLTGTWITLLKGDESLLVSALTGTEVPVSDISSAETDIYADPALIERAEEMGVNILITSVLVPLQYTADKGIIWPFNKFKGEYDISMIASVIDVPTGTMIFTFKESQEIDMGRVPEGQSTPIALDQEILDNVLYELQERLSSEIHDLLAEQSWRGKVSLDDGKIRISGGTDVGISAGTVFDVFENGDAVKSVNGRVYYVNGPKAGEIRVTDVMEDYSLAVPMGEEVFEAGQIITLNSE